MSVQKKDNIAPWTEAEFAKWEKEGPVLTFEYQHEGRTYAFAISEPRLEVLRQYVSLWRRDDALGAGEIVVENSWLAGDAEIKASALLKAGAYLAVAAHFATSIPGFSVVKKQ